MLAAFSSSPSYQLKSYGVGPGGTNSSSSTTYSLQGSAGEQANGSTASSTYTAKNGSIQTEQLNVPGAPTLSNGAGTYYNKLNVIVSTSSNPTDATYAIAISSNSFVTTNYVQADGTLNSSAVYQTYTQWGSGSGTLITGLSASTAYQAKVEAKEGKFTNTDFGAVGSASTVAFSSSISFSISPNTTNIGNLLSGTVVTSSNIAFTFATNAASGGKVYVSGVNGGLKSNNTGTTLSAYTGDLSTQTQGFGIQATSASQTSGGPFATVSPFNGTANNVGSESTTYVPILSSTASVTGGSANVNFQAKASSNTPASNDYQETVTFIAAASF